MLLNNNAKQPLNLYINYPIMLLLKVKVTPKFESKLLFLSLLYYHVYKNTTHDKCHCVFMYDERDKNTNS